MEIERLGIWGRNPPEEWVRTAANRWAQLVKRAALLFMDLFASSPIPRLEMETLVLAWESPDSAEPAQLAESLRVSRQTMTSLLDKLEQAGYLERAPHPTDRRRKSIRLRPRGVAAVRDFVGAVLRREAALFATRSEREVSATLGKLEELLDLAERWNREHPIEKGKSEKRTANS